MGADGASFGVGRLAVELPAICVGHPLRDDFSSCGNEGTITLTTIIEQDGAPMPVLVTVCPQHVRPVRHFLAAHGVGDEIDTWATRTLFEHRDIIERSGIEFWRLERQSA